MNKLIKTIAKHPILTFFIVTLVLCVIVGPSTVGTWYGSAVRQTAAGVVQFFRGAF